MIKRIIAGLICLCFIISIGEKAQAKLIGTFKISAYCEQTNTPKGSRATSTGKTARPNHTIAVDMHDPIAKYGDKLKINGVVYTVEDCGNLNKYGRSLDIFMDSYEEMEEWGVKELKVYKVESKKSKPKKIKRKPKYEPKRKPIPYLVSYLKTYYENRFNLDLLKGGSVCTQAC